MIGVVVRLVQVIAGYDLSYLVDSRWTFGSIF